MSFAIVFFHDDTVPNPKNMDLGTLLDGGALGGGAGGKRLFAQFCPIPAASLCG